MNPDEQIKAIKDIMMEELSEFDHPVLKVRINEILNPNITIADLSAAQDEAYKRGYHEGRGSTFTIMLIWGIVCVTGGVVIGMSVI